MLSFTFVYFLSVSVFYYAQSPCCPAISCCITLSLHSISWLHFLLSLRTLFCHPIFSWRACSPSGDVDVNRDIERHRHVYRHRKTFGCRIDYYFSLKGHGLCDCVVSIRFSPCDMVKKKELPSFPWVHLFWPLKRSDLARSMALKKFYYKHTEA